MTELPPEPRSQSLEELPVQEVAAGVFASSSTIIPVEMTAPSVVAGPELVDVTLQFRVPLFSSEGKSIPAPTGVTTFIEGGDFLVATEEMPPTQTLRVFADPESEPTEDEDPEPSLEDQLLSPSDIDAILDDFRGWLSTLLPTDSEEAPDEETPRVDLFTLMGQFTALRHEVNLQTRAVRVAVDHNAETIRLISTKKPESTAPDEELRPMAKAVIDIADVLALSLRQTEKLRESVEPLLVSLLAQPKMDEPEPMLPTAPPAQPPKGFFAKLFGTIPDSPPAQIPFRREPALSKIDPTVVDKLRQLAAAAADGYSLSLRRVERILPTFGLDTMSCVGEPFDPDTMEVVEVVDDPEAVAGTVLQEIRPGYRWRGKVFRYAQVKVAR